jgi:hypothetical protein
MGKRSTFEGYLRAHGGRPRDVVPPAVVPVILRIAGLDATVDAGTLTGKFLPVGAIPLRVSVIGGGTGGTTPILDVGLELLTPDDDGLANGLTFNGTDVADVVTKAGVLLGTVLTEQAEITYGDDGVGTNNTGGTVDLIIEYTFDDDGVVNN